MTCLSMRLLEDLISHLEALLPQYQELKYVNAMQGVAVTRKPMIFTSEGVALLRRSSRNGKPLPQSKAQVKMSRHKAATPARR